MDGAGDCASCTLRRPPYPAAATTHASPRPLPTTAVFRCSGPSTTPSPSPGPVSTLPDQGHPECARYTDADSGLCPTPPPPMRPPPSLDYLNRSVTWSWRKDTTDRQGCMQAASSLAPPCDSPAMASGAANLHAGHGEESLPPSRRPSSPGGACHMPTGSTLVDTESGCRGHRPVGRHLE